ncbi:MAG: phosphosulfolactate synthase [Planctomycetaceae bacterium]
MVDVDRGVSSEPFLFALGVSPLPPRTEPFDPGYDPVTFAAHVEQSAHLIEIFKLSMATWIVADTRATAKKIAAAHAYGVPCVTGGGPFEIAVANGVLERYLELCAGLGFDRIEAGRGFTDHDLDPGDVVRAARVLGMAVQFELGRKHGGAFDRDVTESLIGEGARWLDAGAAQLVVEARESARSVGLFDADGTLDSALAERFVEAFGFDRVVFEAPNKPSQFALLDHLGPEVHLCNVRLEELLRVEIYRRGLHSDAFANPVLRPGPRAEEPAVARGDR